MLVLEAGRRIHLTSYSLEKPKEPPAFCMTLRKYLPGSWLVNIEQYEFERIAIIQIKTKTGLMHLIIEFFGEGNIILTGEKNEILQALFFKRMRDRNIVRNEVYQYPPSSGKNPYKVTKEELKDSIKVSGEAEIVRCLVRFLGLGGIYSEELLQRANIEKTKLCSEIVDSEIDSIFSNLQGLFTSVSAENLCPQIILDEKDAFVDVIPFKLKRYETYKIQSYETFSKALDEFYVRVTVAEKAAAGVDVGQFRREAERLKRMISEQERALQEGERKIERDKHIGDIIYAHLSDLQALLEKFVSVRNHGGDLTAVITQVVDSKKAGSYPEIFYESFDGRNLSIIVKVDEQQFGLSLRKSIYENAASFYDRGKVVKQKGLGVNVALDDSRKKLVEIEKQLSKVEALKTAAPAEALEDLESRRVKSKEWFEKFRWFKSSEGFLVVAGKDSVSNEVLIKKHADLYDAVFHADIMGSPFVVIKTEGKEPGESTLKEAGEYAAAFSRAWRENMGAADVYWVKPEQLSKSGPSGEFVAHGAFAVSGKRNWLRGTPLKMAIGIILYDDQEAEFIGGPVDAIKTKTKINVTLTPGDQTGKDFLKAILRSLLLQLPKEQREKLGKTSIESIREFVPYTKGRMLQNA
ncbi:MAG: fibronectin-binding domain-containing protein [Crenarchaeota archaeon]|nr:fibronectin-binding domain-containing protein [Thermoproteota archaeon]